MHDFIKGVQNVLKTNYVTYKYINLLVMVGVSYQEPN